MASQRARGPGSITIEEPRLGKLWYAHGCANVKYAQPPGIHGRWVVPAESEEPEEDVFWQPQVRRAAYGRSEASARERCRKKLCEALENDAAYEEQMLDDLVDLVRRTETFECPLDTDPDD